MPVTSTLGALTYNKTVGGQYANNPWVVGISNIANSATTPDLISFDNNGNIWYLQTYNTAYTIKIDTNNAPKINAGKTITGNNYLGNLGKTVISANATTDFFTTSTNFNDIIANMQISMPVKFTGTTFGGVSTASVYYLWAVPPSANISFGVRNTPIGNLRALNPGSGSMQVTFVRNDSVGPFLGRDICFNSTDNSVYTIGQTTTQAPGEYANRLTATFGVHNQFDNNLDLNTSNKILENTVSQTALTPNTITRQVIPSTANSIITLDVAANSGFITQYRYILRKTTGNTVDYDEFISNTNTNQVGGANVDSNVAILSTTSNGNILVGGAQTLLTLVYGRNYNSFIEIRNSNTGARLQRVNLQGSGYTGMPTDLPGRISDAKDDGSGNIYVSLRQFEGNFAPNTGGFPSINIGSYVVKLDNSGNSIWQKRLPNLTQINKLTADTNTNNVYFFTRYNSTTAYVGQFDTNGNIAWVNDIGVIGNSVITSGNVELKYYDNFLYIGQNLFKTTQGDVGFIFYRIAANGQLPGNANANSTITMANTTFNFTYSQGNANSAIFSMVAGNIQLSNTVPNADTTSGVFYAAPYNDSSIFVPATIAKL